MNLDCYLYSGWDPKLRPAVTRRDWMDAAPESYAYRCLPLAIANAHGWEALTHCGFSARWNGGRLAEDVEIIVDEGAHPDWTPVALFGMGTITFHIAGLFRTPPGWNLWVGGPPNFARDGIVPLNGIIETDWSPYSFTMNWKLTRPDHWVRFDAGEAFCHMFPIERGAIEKVQPRYFPIESAPELKAQFEAWSASRDAFQIRMREHPPERPADKWQKLYYRGLDPAGVAQVDDHRSKLNLESFTAAEQQAVSAPPPQVCPHSAQRTTTMALAKRDWLLSTYERLRALSAAWSNIPEYHGISAQQFLDAHYAASFPAILRGAVAHWPAVGWTPQSLNAKIGNAPIEFQGSRNDNAQFELDKDAHKRILGFADYIAMVEQPAAGNDAYITAYNSATNRAALAVLDADIGDLPGILTDGVKGMLWIGPGGTFTPLHHDLTNNLFIQIVGHKSVDLISPNFVAKLANRRHVFSDVHDIDNPRLDEGEAAIDQVRRFTVELEPGDALFLPIGWWHQVRSHDFSVSITNTAFVWPNTFNDDYPEA